nr:MAG TPA: hypothetical protein [Caudoviricetes sp.]DAL84482.1 MAG TPA: hypothetical protein [Caudoviricetes sp.]DAM24355.1 MAG TPA: hypothetical protein [Caudoviricetes sp.]
MISITCTLLGFYPQPFPVITKLLICIFLILKEDTSLCQEKTVR